MSNAKKKPKSAADELAGLMAKAQKEREQKAVAIFERCKKDLEEIGYGLLAKVELNIVDGMRQHIAVIDIQGGPKQ
jgi:hypothetical protein